MSNLFIFQVLKKKKHYTKKYTFFAVWLFHSIQSVMTFDPFCCWNPGHVFLPKLLLAKVCDFEASDTALQNPWKHIFLAFILAAVVKVFSSKYCRGKKISTVIFLYLENKFFNFLLSSSVCSDLEWHRVTPTSRSTRWNYRNSRSRNCFKTQKNITPKFR